MSVVFVDTVGLLALWNANDQWHTDALRAFAGINDGRTTLMTTSYVLLECGNAVSRTSFRNEACHLREQFEAAGIGDVEFRELAKGAAAVLMTRSLEPALAPVSPLPNMILLAPTTPRRP